jgi:hypothetical protein
MIQDPSIFSRLFPQSYGSSRLGQAPGAGPAADDDPTHGGHDESTSLDRGRPRPDRHQSGGSNNPTVVLKAKVFEYIAVWGTNDASATLDVAGVTGTGGVNDNDGSANAAFNVTTNVAHDITLSWDTWDHGGGTQADYRHTDDSCSIGGTVNLDTNPGTTGGIETAESGNGSLLHEGANPTWMKAYGIAAEVRPNVTDCTGDIAKPGEYQLGVDITVSKAS